MDTREEYAKFVANRKGHDLSCGIAQIDFEKLVEAVNIGVGLALREVEEEFGQIRRQMVSSNSHAPELGHARGQSDYLVRASLHLQALLDTAWVLNGAETRADILWCNRPPESQLTNAWDGE